MLQHWRKEAKDATSASTSSRCQQTSSFWRGMYGQSSQLQRTLVHLYSELKSVYRHASGGLYRLVQSSHLFSFSTAILLICSQPWPPDWLSPRIHHSGGRCLVCDGSHPPCLHLPSLWNLRALQSTTPSIVMLGVLCYAVGTIIGGAVVKPGGLDTPGTGSSCKKVILFVILFH